VCTSHLVFKHVVSTLSEKFNVGFESATFIQTSHSRFKTRKMARVSPIHSDASEEVAPAKDKKAKKSEQPMEVDEDEDSGEEGGEEYEIEAILDAKKGSFPDVRSPLHSKPERQLKQLFIGKDGLLRQMEKLWP
jgi:hypothetical protein